MARGGAPALGSLCAADSRAGGPRSMAPHGLILTITIALGAAFLGGFVAARLRLPPLVGYLAAGIAVGPFTPGLAADPTIANELAEVGVILLMFGVGVHFSLADLWAVRWIAVPGAMGQIVIATAVTALVVPLWGWTYAQGIVFGLAIAISSTVVLIRTLTDVGLLESAHGKIAVGWVVVEDLAIVIVLVLLPSLAPVLGGTAVGGGEALRLRVAAVVALIVVRKWLVSSGIVLTLGYPIRTALIVGAGLAQIGEFSFVLSEVDRQLGILPAEGHDLIIAAAIITITLNSLLFRSIEPLAERLRDVRVVRAFDDRRAGVLARLERDRAEKLQRHAVVAGHGRVGSLVTRALQRRNMEVLVVEQDRRVIQDLRAAGTAAIYGDAAHA